MRRKTGRVIGEVTRWSKVEKSFSKTKDDCLSQHQRER